MYYCIIDMSLNDIIIKFATVYVEMVSLDKIYEYRTALLR